MATVKNIDPLPLVRRKWAELSYTPEGREQFSRLVGKLAPYTDSVGATITVMRPGYAEGLMPDVPAVGNHIGSLHAGAQWVFAEEIAGLAFVASLPDGMQFVVAGAMIDYDAPAHGRIVAKAWSPTPIPGIRKTYRVAVELYDEHGTLLTGAVFRYRTIPNEA